MRIDLTQACGKHACFFKRHMLVRAADATDDGKDKEWTGKNVVRVG
jgi:hypothetical protein